MNLLRTSQTMSRRVYKIRALVTGICGQDGAYLAKYLLDEGYKVFGGFRGINTDTRNLRYLGIDDRIEFVGLDLESDVEIRNSVDQIMPDLIFNLAAVSSLSVSETQPELTRRVNFEGPLKLFEAGINANSQIRIFQASSALVFGATNVSPQSEQTYRNPDTAYGHAKRDLDLILERMRERDVFVSSGILYNHESPLRGTDFVSQKIVEGLAGLKAGITDTPVNLGNLSAVRDWSHAADFTRGMVQVLKADEPGEYVFASGVPHRVRDWIQISGEHLGFEPEFAVGNVGEYVLCRRTGQTLVQSYEQFVKNDCGAQRVGNPAKLESIGWYPEYDFQRLVVEMTDAASRRYAN